MLDALLITRMQGEMTAALHESESELAIETSADGLMALAMAQHRANFELWHEEDKARVPGVADAEIARVKRAIDRLNQRRNDLMEKMDAWLMERLEQNDAAPLHSETPGLMIDRLSDPGAEDLPHARRGAPGKCDGASSAAERRAAVSAGRAARRSGGVSGCLVGGGAEGDAAIQALSADEDVQRS